MSDNKELEKLRRLLDELSDEQAELVASMVAEMITARPKPHHSLPAIAYQKPSQRSEE